MKFNILTIATALLSFLLFFDNTANAATTPTVTYRATASAKTTKVTAKVPLKIKCEDIIFTATATYTDDDGNEIECISNELHVRVCRIQPVVISYTTEGVTRTQELK